MAGRRPGRADAVAARPPAGEIAPRLLLSALHQVRTLADPLRMRIVEVLRREAATPKQVALTLGERPSRLYHHVAALERAGLVRVVGTRPVRGAVEKYYQPVARQFVVDRALFAPAQGGRRSAALGAVEAMTADILGTAMTEVRDGLLAGTLPLEDPDRVEIARVPVRAGDARIVALMGALRDLVRAAAAADAAEDDADAREYRLTVAFYPLAARPAAPGSVGPGEGARGA